jgi:hypothetical protein
MKEKSPTSTMGKRLEGLEGFKIGLCPKIKDKY